MTYPTRSDPINHKEKGDIPMSFQNNVEVVKDFFAAMGNGDKPGLLALSAEDIERIIPGKIGRLPVRTADTPD
jgi:hypothetical protein